MFLLSENFSDKMLHLFPGKIDKLKLNTIKRKFQAILKNLGHKFRIFSFQEDLSGQDFFGSQIWVQAKSAIRRSDKQLAS